MFNPTPAIELNENALNAAEEDVFDSELGHNLPLTREQAQLLAHIAVEGYLKQEARERSAMSR